MRNSLSRIAARTVAALFLAALASTTADSQTFTRSGSLGTGPLFDSPNFGAPPTSTAGFGNAFYFDAFAFNVSVGGSYTFNASAAFAPALFLYQGSFNPSSPLTNILFGASPEPFEGNPGLPFSLVLQPAFTYVLVTSTFLEGLDPGISGAFTNVISCPVRGSITGCVPGQITPANVNVVPEPSTVVLSAAGLLALGAVVRRRRTRA
ncbi:MAG: PEP-CTERM sorting domain-containing protein [Gemmatimonadota bacterium]